MIIRITKKGQMELTVKTLFIVFIVILVFVVMFMLLQNNIQQSQDRINGVPAYTVGDSFLLSILSDPELIVGSNSNLANQEPVQAVFDADKLQNLDGSNSELQHLKNFGFLYTIKVKDLSSGKEWILGLREKPFFTSRAIVLSYPVAIQYNMIPQKVDIGKIFLSIYSGGIPSFIGDIKKACSTHGKTYTYLNNEYPINYNSEDNLLNISNFIFYPNFGCEVQSFNIPPSNNKIVRIVFNDGSVKIYS